MSIDTAVREVVDSHVKEAMTTIIDEKIQKAVAQTTVENLEETLDEKITEKVDEVAGDFDIDSKIELAIENVTPDSIGAAYYDHSHDYAEEDHEHDSYDVWINIESYVEDTIDSKIQTHVEELKHGGQPTTIENLQDLKIDGSALNTHLKIIEKFLGIEPCVDGSFFMNGKAQDKIELFTKPTVVQQLEQLMAWATHIDKILKAGAQSDLFPTAEKELALS